LSSISDPGRTEAAPAERFDTEIVSDSFVQLRATAAKPSDRLRPRDPVPLASLSTVAPSKAPPRWAVSAGNAACAAAYAAVVTPRLTPLPSPHASSGPGPKPFGMAPLPNQPRSQLSQPLPVGEPCSCSIEDCCLAQMEQNSDSGSGTASPTHMSDVAVCLSLDRSKLAGTEYCTKRPLLTPRAECLGVEPLEETPMLETYRSRATLSPRTANGRRSLCRTIAFSVTFSKTVVARIYNHSAPPMEFAETSAQELRQLLARDGPRPGWESEKFVQRTYTGSDSDSDSNADWDSFR
jgi:hypothetical protein